MKKLKEEITDLKDDKDCLNDSYSADASEEYRFDLGAAEAFGEQ